MSADTPLIVSYDRVTLSVIQNMIAFILCGVFGCVRSEMSLNIKEKLSIIMRIVQVV